MSAPTEVLAFNDPVHDSSFCRYAPPVLFHVELERWTRVKYETANPLPFFCELFPDEAERWTQVAIEEGDHLAPFVRRLRRAGPAGLARSPELARAVRAAAAPAVRPRAGDELPPPVVDEGPLRAFLAHLARPEVTVHYLGHHACHVANAFHSSGLEAALTVSLDGGGFDYGLDPAAPGPRREIHGAIYDCSPEGCRPLEQLERESLGLAWFRAVTDVLGLAWGEEGTVMAMAALGDASRFRAEVDRPELWLPGPSRLGDAERAALAGRLRGWRAALDGEQDRFDFAAALQAATEERARRLLQRHVTPAVEHLCLTGGVFLNCQLTGKIRGWFPWLRSVYLPPAPYDGGISLGAAQLVAHERLGAPPVRWPAGIAPFALGRGYGPTRVLGAVRSRRLPARAAAVAEIVERLEAGDVVGVFAGAAESGRRALGHRSILADPRRAAMKERLNREIKHRQWFRPFAPMVLAERAADWFACEPGFRSPYMSFAVPVRAERREAIPAVVHADGTARVQTVHRELDPSLHALLEDWERRTGVPVLLNTSFNDREPIVETPEQALDTFARAGLDALWFADAGLLVERAGEDRGARDAVAAGAELRAAEARLAGARRELARLQASRSWRLTVPLRLLHDRLSALARRRDQARWRTVTYAGIRVHYQRRLDGGGSSFGQEFVPFLRGLGVPRQERVFEWCAGPGFIGFSLLAHGLADSLCLADVHPPAVEACRRTIRDNGLAGRVTALVADNLEGLPAAERWTLVVGNPPHFADAHAGERRSHDPDWRLHRGFFARVGEHLAPGGVVVLQENQRGSTAEELRPLVEEAGLRVVFAVGDRGTRSREDLYWFLGVARRDDELPAWARALDATGR